jgi:RimJ/RimL family protein N-acetyltransferase
VNEHERIRAFRRSLEERAADRIEPSPYGAGLFVDALPEIYDLNFLRGDRGAPDELVAEADRLMETVLHRKVVTDESPGDGFRAFGWQTTAHLMMAHHGEPDVRLDTTQVRDVPFDAVAPLRVTEYPDARLGEFLNEARRRLGKAVDTRWLASFDGDQLVAWCELRSRDGIAQIEDVNTLVGFRGRGHGRRVVQHALDEARATHGLVFLEALEDDWPRDLYAKLGFDIVGRRYLHLLPPSPLASLRIRTPRLELRLATVAELRRLFAVALGGIHDPEVMPFEIPWTDSPDEHEFLAYHRQKLKTWTPAEWHLNLIAFLDGAPIGSQGLNAVGFAETGRVVTGSWLGRAYQGRGLGTEMRSAILSFAFETLGAKVAVSGAFVENPQSLGVSRKLGYEVVGSHYVSPRGTPVEHTDLELSRKRFAPVVDAEISGADRSWFGVT